MRLGAAGPHTRVGVRARRGVALRRAAAAVVVAGALLACPSATTGAPGDPLTDAPRPGATPPQTPPPAYPEATAAPVPTPAHVPLAAPTHLAIPELGIDAGVEEYTDAQVRDAGGWVDPPRRDTVAWWSGGGTPGSPADNTVYLYGHVARTAAVFNPLAEAVVGQTVTLTTAAGTLTYRVTEVLPPVLKADLPTVPEVAAAVPGRLVLIGCHREPDQGSAPTTRNRVVIAEQVPSA